LSCECWAQGMKDLWLNLVAHIEPVFFTSSINWIPSRYQEIPSNVRGNRKSKRSGLLSGLGANVRNRHYCYSTICTNIAVEATTNFTNITSAERLQCGIGSLMSQCSIKRSWCDTALITVIVLTSDRYPDKHPGSIPYAQYVH
jgi:hypothetical protein